MQAPSLPIILLVSVVFLIFIISGIKSYRFRTSAAGRFISAAKTGDVEGVLNALKSGVDPNAATPFSHQTALRVAAAGGHEQVVAALLDIGAQVDLVEEGYPTVLAEAVLHNRTQIASLLLAKGANPNCYLFKKEPLLYRAAYTRNVPMVELLLKHGAKEDFPCGPELAGGLCPDVVRQLVKEVLDAHDPRPCDICGAIRHGLARDFVVVQAESRSAMATYGAKLSTTRYQKLREASFFACYECVKAELIKSRRGLSKPDASPKEIVEWDPFQARDCLKRIATEQLGHALGSTTRGDVTFTTAVWSREAWYRKMGEIAWRSASKYIVP